MKNIIKGAAALVFGSGAGAVLSFVLALLLARGWGKEGLGVYTAALAWITPLSLLTEAGLGTLFVRDLARQPDQMAAYTRAAIRQRLLVGGLIAFFLCIAAFVLFGDAASCSAGLTCQAPTMLFALWLSAPLIVILPLYATFTALLRVQGRMVWVAALNIGMLLVQVMLTGLLWQQHLTIELVLLINTLTSAGQCATAAWVTREMWQIPMGAGLARQTPTTLMQRGLPFAVAAVIAALQIRLIVIVLEQATNPAEVGLYAAAFKGVEIARLLALSVFDALFPVLSSLAADRARVQRVFAMMCLVLTGGALIGALALSLLAGALIPGLYGAAFAAAVPVLEIATWGMPLLVLRQSRILYGYALGAERRVNWLMLLGVVGQGAAALLLIPSYGAIGAAGAFVIGEAWGAAVLWVVNLSERV